MTANREQQPGKNQGAFHGELQPSATPRDCAARSTIA